MNFFPEGLKMWCANGRIKGKSSWNVHVVSKVRSAIARNRDWGRCNFAKRKNVKYTRAIGLERSAARSEKSGEKIAGRTRSCDIVTSWLPRCLAASQPALRRRIRIRMPVAYLCYPCTCVPIRAPSGTRPRRYGARLLSLPDSLAARRPTGYAARVSLLADHPSRTDTILLFSLSCVFSPQFLSHRTSPALFAPFPTTSSRRPKVSSKNDKVLSFRTLPFSPLRWNLWTESII